MLQTKSSNPKSAKTPRSKNLNPALSLKSLVVVLKAREANDEKAKKLCTALRATSDIKINFQEFSEAFAAGRKLRSGERKELFSIVRQHIASKRKLAKYNTDIWEWDEKLHMGFEVKKGLNYEPLISAGLLVRTNQIIIGRVNPLRTVAPTALGLAVALALMPKRK